MAQTIELSKIQKDHSQTVIKSVYNPMKEDFIHSYDGEEMTIPAGEIELFPENIAVLMAQHLAMAIVRKTAKEDRAQILKNIEKSKHVVMSQKPFPYFSKKVGNLAMILVRDKREETPISKEDVKTAMSDDVARGKKSKIKEDLPKKDSK